MIKKFILAIAIIFASVLAPLGTVYAGSEDDEEQTETETPTYVDCRYFLGLKSWDCGADIYNIHGEDKLSSSTWTIVVNVLDNITVIAAYLIIGYILYGGYLYILSSGESNKVAEGKKAIIHGITGLAIVSLANIIMNTLRWILLKGSDKNFTDCVTKDGCVEPENLFTNSIQWVIGISTLVAVVFIIYGGISYITSSGDANKAKKSKDIILHAIIGLIIIGLTEAIVLFVTNILIGAAS